MSKTHLSFVGPHIFVSDEAADRLAARGTWEQVGEMPSPAVLVAASGRADILSTWSPITAEVASSLSDRTRAIIFLSTGTDGLVDRESRRILDERGVTTMYTPGYATDAVAEFNILGAGALARHIVSSNRDRLSGPVSFAPYVGSPLKGSVFGVVGLGPIGCRTADLARAHGAQVVTWTRSERRRPSDEFAERLPLNTLFAVADFIAICVALTPETTALVASELLQVAKPATVIVNTARPDVMDPAATLDTLQARPETRLMVDDLCRNDHRWGAVLALPNVVATPHIAFNTMDALHKCTATAVDAAEAYLDGEERHVFC